MPVTSVLDEARDQLSAAVTLRRRLHRHPELGLELPRTQEAVLEALEPLGLDVTTGTTTTSVVAELVGEQPGPTVLLRGDMDALPMPEDTGLDFASEVDGAMHACGHDSHTAMLVGAARLLTNHRADIKGRVRFMFQPGEEGFHGARFMLDEGLLDAPGDGEAPSFAFALHVTPAIPSGLVALRGGTLMASSDVLRITVTGRGGHASMPHQALDPIPIACEIVTAIQAMVTRRVDVFDPAVVTVARISAGTTSNVIPERAEIEGTIRAVSDATRKAVKDDLRRLAEGIAEAHGAGATVDIEPGYPVTVNNADAAAVVHRVAGDVLGADRAFTMPAPVMGAEDWSYVLQRVPGAMAFLGAMPPGTDPARVAPNHSNRMMLDEAAMTAGIAMYSAVAFDRLGA